MLTHTHCRFYSYRWIGSCVPDHGKANTRIVYQAIPTHHRTKGRRLVILAAWRGIKVNERTGTTYYFSLLGFYSFLTHTLVISLDTEVLLHLCSSFRLDTLLIFFSPKSNCQRYEEEKNTTRDKKERERKRRGRTERIEAKVQRVRGGYEHERGESVKVLKGREKWQTLSCHEALDVFILPQAVLEERRSARSSLFERVRARRGGGREEGRRVFHEIL